MDFCKQFNAKTASRKSETVPVEITVFKDRTFTFITKTPPVSELLRTKANIKKGSKTPGTASAGSIKWSDIEEIAKIKMPDLNAYGVDAAKKVVAGSARSMGLNVID